MSALVQDAAHGSHLRLVPPTMVPFPTEEEATNLDVAEAFVLRLFEKDRFGFIILAFAHPDRPGLIHESVPIGPTQQPILRRHLERYIDGHNCFVAIANFAHPPYWDSEKKRKAGKGRKDGKSGSYVFREGSMVGHCRWTICDRDDHPLGPSLPPPTFIVETSGGKYQDWYELASPVAKEVAKDLNARIAAASGVGNEAIDATRLLRIPGTRNLWPRNHREIVRVVSDTDRIFTPEDLAHLPPPSPAQPKEKKGRKALPRPEIVGQGEGGNRASTAKHSPYLHGSAATDPPSWSGGPLTQDQAKRFFCDEQIVAHVARFLGMPVDRELGQAFCCVLPGHEERNPSAVIIQSGNGEAYFYLDNHAGTRGGERFLTLTEVYCAQRTGVIKKFDTAPAHATWMLRLLHDAGLLLPIAVSLPPLTGKRKPIVDEVYDGIRLLLGLRWAVYGESPVPLSHRFVAEWIGRDPEHEREKVGRAIQTLHAKGIIERVGSHPGTFGKDMALYLPSSGASEKERDVGVPSQGTKPFPKRRRSTSNATKGPRLIDRLPSSVAHREVSAAKKRSRPFRAINP